MIRPARGTAMAAVLILFTLIAATIMAMGLAFATQSRRTTATVHRAQLTQLLLAATPLAEQEIAAHGVAVRDVRVATPVEDAALILHISPSEIQSTPQVRVRVEAAFRGSKAAQTLTLTRASSGHWVVQGAELTQIP